MARQSILAGELSGIFGDLAKIAMSNTANKQAQALKLESNLIELEMRQLSSKIATTEAEFKSKKEEFQESTGQVFKLSDEFKTPGFEKFSTSIANPALDGYTNKINVDRQDLATREAQLDSLNQLLQGPIADIQSFHAGAADPAFSGDPNILEASDFSEAALEDYLGGKYKDVNPSMMAGAKTQIRANTVMKRMEAMAASDQLATQLLKNQASRTIDVAQRPYLNVLVNEKNIAATTRQANSLLDTDGLMTNLSDVSLAEASFIEAYNKKAGDMPYGTKEAAELSLNSQYYKIGATLLGEAPTPYEEVLMALEEGTIDSEQVDNILAHGAEYYEAAKKTLPSKHPTTQAAIAGTNMPVINMLIESNEFLENNDNADWAAIEEITGYSQELWEKNVPLLKLSMEAIQIAKQRNLEAGVRGLQPESNEPDSTDAATVVAADDEVIDYSGYQKGYEAYLASGNNSEALESVENIQSYSQFSPDENITSPFSIVEGLDDPFASSETYDAELDFDYETTAEEQEELYLMAVPKEHAKFRALVNRSDELQTRLEGLPISGDNYKERKLIKDELGGGSGGIGRIFGEDMDVKISNAKKEMEWAFNRSQQATKTLGAYAESIMPGNEKFIQDLIEILGVDTSSRLYSIDPIELSEALVTLLADIGDEELVHMIDPQSAQIISREYWADNKNVRQERMNKDTSGSLSDGFWDLFKVKN